MLYFFSINIQTLSIKIVLILIQIYVQVNKNAYYTTTKIFFLKKIIFNDETLIQLKKIKHKLWCTSFKYNPPT